MPTEYWDQDMSLQSRIAEFLEAERKANEFRSFLDGKAGEMLREWREEHDISRVSLAAELGVHVNIIAKIERGDTRMYRPLMEKLVAYMNAHENIMVDN